MRGADLGGLLAEAVQRAAIVLFALLRAGWVAACSFATGGVRASRTRRAIASRFVLAPTDLADAMAHALRHAAARATPTALIVLEPATVRADEAATRARLEWACLGASRSQDVVGAVGDERYAVLLPEADERTARFVAGRIARALLVSPDDAIEITMGVAIVPAMQAEKTTPSSVLAVATRGLLRTRVGGSGIHRTQPEGAGVASRRLAS